MPRQRLQPRATSVERIEEPVRVGLDSGGQRPAVVNRAGDGQAPSNGHVIGRHAIEEELTVPSLRIMWSECCSRSMPTTAGQA
jgi:hypothetical protein